MLELKKSLSILFLLILIIPLRVSYCEPVNTPHVPMKMESFQVNIKNVNDTGGKLEYNYTMKFSFVNPSRQPSNILLYLGNLMTDIEEGIKELHITDNFNNSEYYDEKDDFSYYNVTIPAFSEIEIIMDIEPKEYYFSSIGFIPQYIFQTGHNVDYDLTIKMPIKYTILESTEKSQINSDDKYKYIMWEAINSELITEFITLNFFPEEVNISDLEPWYTTGSIKGNSYQLSISNVFPQKSNVILKQSEIWQMPYKLDEIFLEPSVNLQTPIIQEGSMIISVSDGIGECTQSHSLLRPGKDNEGKFFVLNESVILYPRLVVNDDYYEYQAIFEYLVFGDGIYRNPIPFVNFIQSNLIHIETNDFPNQVADMDESMVKIILPENVQLLSFLASPEDSVFDVSVEKNKEIFWVFDSPEGIPDGDYIATYIVLPPFYSFLTIIFFIVSIPLIKHIIYNYTNREFNHYTYYAYLISLIIFIINTYQIESIFVNPNILLILLLALYPLIHNIIYKDLESRINRHENGEYIV